MQSLFSNKFFVSFLALTVIFVLAVEPAFAEGSFNFDFSSIFQQAVAVFTTGLVGLDPLTSGAIFLAFILCQQGVDSLFFSGCGSASQGFTTAIPFNAGQCRLGILATISSGGNTDWAGYNASFNRELISSTVTFVETLRNPSGTEVRNPQVNDTNGNGNLDNLYVEVLSRSWDSGDVGGCDTCWRCGWWGCFPYPCNCRPPRPPGYVPRPFTLQYQIIGVEYNSSCTSGYPIADVNVSKIGCNFLEFAVSSTSSSAYFSVERDGTPIASNVPVTTNPTIYTDTGLASSTTYSYKFSVTDNITQYTQDFNISETTVCPPECDFSASPDNQCSSTPCGRDLLWDCVDPSTGSSAGVTCELSQFGGVAPSGSQTVSIDRPTTFYLACDNSDGRSIYRVFIDFLTKKWKEVSPN